MNGQKRIVIVGATSAIAEHCARLWAAEAPAEMILVGRDRLRTEIVAADLRVRAPATPVISLETAFLDPLAIRALADAVCANGVPDIVLIAHGMLPQQQDCQHDLAGCRAALDINGVSPVLFAEAFAAHMARAGRGSLAIIGSVAGDRGRKSNYIYGAAKGMVARHAQGLQHRFAGSAVQVVLIKPGPTDTPMTAHLVRAGQRLASVELVARAIVRGIGRGRRTIYAPGKWALIMMIIRHLPDFIFRKLDI